MRDIGLADIPRSAKSHAGLMDAAGGSGGALHGAAFGRARDTGTKD
jgi:hypothetical protein